MCTKNTVLVALLTTNRTTNLVNLQLVTTVTKIQTLEPSNLHPKATNHQAYNIPWQIEVVLPLQLLPNPTLTISP